MEKRLAFSYFPHVKQGPLDAIFFIFWECSYKTKEIARQTMRSSLLNIIQLKENHVEKYLLLWL